MNKVFQAALGFSLLANVVQAQETAFFVQDDCTGGFDLVKRSLDDVALVTVGPLDRPLVALAFDSVGRLFGLERGAGALVGLDPATGATLSEHPLDWPQNLEAITFTIDQQGRFWGLGCDGALPCSVLAIDPASGTVAEVASIGIRLSLLTDSPLGLIALSTFSVFAVEVGSGQLVEILSLDPGVGSLGGVADVDADGRVVFIEESGPANPGFYYLRALDLETLVSDDLGGGSTCFVGVDLSGPAIAPRGPLPIPTLHGLGLSVLAAVLALIGVGRLRARS